MYCHANEPRAACPSVSDRKVFWLSLVGEFSSLDGTSVYSFVEHPRVYLGSRSHTGVPISLCFWGSELFAETLMNGQGLSLALARERGRRPVGVGICWWKSCTADSCYRGNSPPTLPLSLLMGLKQAVWTGMCPIAELHIPHKSPENLPSPLPT